MTVTDLPALNATLNLTAAVFLMLGYYNIKQGRRETHRKFMFLALITSSLFLISYVAYHLQAGSTPYPYQGWTRTLYFVILIPHVILAAANVPFIIVLVTLILRGKESQHRRLARWVWPSWMFVSLSGVLIYFMLYQF